MNMDADVGVKSIVLTAQPGQFETECDCACPGTSFRLVPKPGNTLTRFTTVSDIYTISLPHTHRLVFSPYAPDGPGVLNPPAWRRYRAFVKQPRALTEAVDHKFAAQNLIVPVGTKLQMLPKRTDTLSAWLHITNACNLDCSYCYVRKSSARMDEVTGRQVMERLFATAGQNGFTRIKLKYAGGEPMLHFKLIRLLHGYARQWSEKTGIETDEVILSNGTAISPQIADWLLESGMKLMVSMDGIGRIHDRQRPIKTGEKSFARIERIFSSVLLPRGIKPTVSITITPHSASGTADMVKWAMRRELPFSLNFCRGGSVSRQNRARETSAIIKGMQSAYRAIEEQLPSYPFLNGLLDRMQTRAHTHTCGVARSYLVISHTGAVSQCQMHFDKPVSDTLHADTVLPLLAKGRIRNLSIDEKSECRDCHWRYRCTGGCPLETYRSAGDWNGRNPNCEIYRTLYPEALRLEGLRLMKTQMTASQLGSQ